jgi:phytol kinase
MTAAGGMISNILFGKLAVVGYVVTGWGDAVGEPVGTRWGNHRYRVPTLTGIKCHRSLDNLTLQVAATGSALFLLKELGFF